MRLLLAFLISLLVQSMDDFHSLPSALDDAMKAAPDVIEVRLSPGIYYYGEDFIHWDGVRLDNTAVRIVGDGAILIASDNEGDGYRLENGYVDLDSLCPVDSRTEMRQAFLWPLPVPFRKGVFRIRCREDIPVPEEDIDDYTLLLTQWYIGALYPVEKITRRHIYFRREEKYHTGIWSELRYGRCLPRYMLCGPPKEDGRNLYACQATRFLTIENTVLKSFHLTGVHFLGNGDGDWMIRLKKFRTEGIEVDHCRFEGIKSGCIYVGGSDHFRMHDSEMHQCYRWGVYVWTDSHDCLIENNRFIDNGLRISFNPVVDCKADGFIIRNNYFEDFSYSAIGLGNHYTEPDTTGTRGVVEGNEICMSESFRNCVFRQLIDSGAIYVWTRNNSLTIRNNYIHDIDGPHGNRGILCDDGAVNVHIYGNKILRIGSGYCIDLRRRTRIERKKVTYVKKANIGNVMYENIIDGRVRYYVRKDDPTSFKGKNIIVK